MRTSEDPRSLATAVAVDTLSDRFEAAWKAGEAPRLEDYLALGTPELRKPLLEALLDVEIELLAQSGQSPAVDDYRRRFSQDVETVNAVFAKASDTKRSGPAAHRSPDESPTTSPSAAATKDIALTVSVHSPESDTSRMGTASTPQPVHTRIGRFEIKSALGQGAFGTVYRARDTQLNRDVAVKVPREGMLGTPEDRERFFREARAAATLEHPGVCPVHEVGEQDGHPYIVMALIEGRTLDDLLKSGKPISAKQAAHVVRKMALALDEAHTRGIIHRDLKPSNVMINRRGEPVVMDFGLARLGPQVDVQLTKSGMLMGTPAYMSPEQARGYSKDISAATDIYSLGVILYELVTRRRPFNGSFAEVLGQILHVPPPPPSSFGSHVSPRLEAIILTAMAKAANDRYASMAEFAAALSGWLREQELSPPVPPQAAVAVASTNTEPAAANPPRPSSRGSTWALAALAVPLVCLAAAVILYIQTPDGTVRVQIDDPRIKVVVDKDSRLTFHGADHPHEITLQPGPHGLIVSRDGFTFGTTNFELRRRGITALKVEFMRGAIQVSQDGKLLDTLPQPAGVAFTPRMPIGDPPGPAMAPFDATQARRHQERWAQYLDVPVESEIDLGGGQRLKMVLIPPGEFLIGSTDDMVRPFLGQPQNGMTDAWSLELISSETPQHTVRITRPFWMSRYEVTRGQFRSFVDHAAYKTDPERDGKGGFGSLSGRWRQDPRFVWNADLGYDYSDEHPVVNVTWNDAAAFTGWVSEQAGVDCQLPTEAQWEFACRAGTTTAWFFGDLPDSVGEYAWIRDNATNYARPVGQLRANPFGLYDMSGNVEEWCRDRFAANYSTLPATDPSGAPEGNSRILRGGSCSHFSDECRSARRMEGAATMRYNYRGFRVAVMMKSWPPARFASELDSRWLPRFSSLPAGKSSLHFDGINDYVEIANWKYAGDHPLTVEGWITPEPPAKSMEFISCSEGSGFALLISRSSGWGFSTNFDANYVHASAPFTPEFSNRRVHVAGVIDGQEVRLYLGGVAARRRTATGAYRPSPVPLTLGANPNIQGRVTHYAGLMDEVRISRVSRYTVNFKPADTFEPDADTIALYHFDEGQGDVLTDSSGNGYHGKIAGARWITVGSP